MSCNFVTVLKLLIASAVHYKSYEDLASKSFYSSVR